MLLETPSLACKGHIQLIAEHKETGVKTVVIDQPNLVLYMGQQMLAQSLAGNPQYNIWGIRFQFQNGAYTAPVVDKTYSQPFSSPVGTIGNVAVPLLAQATFSSSVPYTNNIARFQATLIPGDQLDPHGTSLQLGTSQLFEIGLIADPSFGENVFARTQFNPVLLDSAYNLTVIWGIQFTT